MNPSSSVLLLLFISWMLLIAPPLVNSSSDFFIAGVLQHFRVFNETAENYGIATQLQNLEIFEKYVKIGKQQGVQIMVFPEVSLGKDEEFRWEMAKYGENFPAITTPFINPCLESETFKTEHPVLTKASCIARENNIILVTGCVDVQNCSRETDPDCPYDDRYIYNSAIVLDEKGNYIQKYHKYHLFITITGVFDQPKHPEIKYYDTYFGVRFGLFICFDMIFPHPGIDLLQLGIRHFTFPTAWTNVPPLVTATQYQQGWSRRFEATLLAANDALDYGNSGSGIYHQGEILTSFFDPSLAGPADEKLLIAKVPISNNQKPSNYPKISSNNNTQNLVAPAPRKPNTPQDLNQLKQVLTSSIFVNRSSICGIVPGGCQFFYAKPGLKGNLTAIDNNITCRASFSISSCDKPGEPFALAAISSWIFFSQWIDVQVCGIIRCIDDYICVFTYPWLPEVYESSTVFDHFEITGDFSSEFNVFPLLATRNGQIEDKNLLQFTNNNTLSSSQITKPLISASLFGLFWE